MTEAVKEAKDAKKEVVVELEKGADTVVGCLLLVCSCSVLRSLAPAAFPLQYWLSWKGF